MSEDAENQEHTPSDAPADAAQVTRAELALAVARFQLKLLMDGMRDILLSPISIVAGLIGILSTDPHPDRAFRRVMVWGRKSEDWINLFGYRKGAQSDELLQPFEQRVLDEVRGDGLVGRASRGLDNALNKRAKSPGESQHSDTDA
ncbi:MAG: hypothetical protein NXH85_13715 [Pseudomonadaceae bacterium]|nr:hypothetical protein [Pseudomonadaceae bacterium]